MRPNLRRRDLGPTIFNTVCAALVIFLVGTVALTRFVIDPVNRAVWPETAGAGYCWTEFKPDGTSTLVCTPEPPLDYGHAAVFALGIALVVVAAYPSIRRLGSGQRNGGEPHGRGPEG